MEVSAHVVTHSVCWYREEPAISPRVLAQWPQTGFGPVDSLPGNPLEATQAYQTGKIPKQLGMQVGHTPLGAPLALLFICLQVRHALLPAEASFIPTVPFWMVLHFSLSLIMKWIPVVVTLSTCARLDRSRLAKASREHL